MGGDGSGPEQRGREIVQWLDATLWAARVPVAEPRSVGRLLRRVRLVWWKATRRVANAVFERRLETSEDVVRADHFHPERIWYTPSGWRYLARALKGVAVDPGDVFLDYGCGKGRVVYQAAGYPFARVIGVEISPELSDIARRNLERHLPELRCKNIEIVTADAAGYELPDDVTFAYLFHPFIGETLRRVVEQIVASLERRPRRFRLLYALPAGEDVLLQTGRFRRVRTISILHREVRERLAIYESL